MITKEQLAEIGFHRWRGTEYCDLDCVYVFCIKTQEIFTYNYHEDSLEPICRVKDIEHLEEVLYLTSGVDFREQQAIERYIYGQDI